MAKLKGKITKQMKATAAANGISVELLRYRLARNWDTAKAVSHPPRKQAPAERSNPDMLAVAKQNGIDSSTYRTRVRDLGVNEFDAAVMPKMTKAEKAARSAEARGGIPQHLIKEAASNGIKYITLYRRLRVVDPPWDERRAVTEPPIVDRLPVRGRIHAAAEQLGIDWKAIRATQEHGKAKHDPVILAIAEANGINYNTFIYRTVTKSPRMTPLEAATAPILSSGYRHKRVLV